jgi:hypothetical protein
LLLTSAELLLEEGDLAGALVAEVHELIVKVLNLNLETFLDFLFLLLFVGELVLEVNLNLGLLLS